jgi:hypothetical protein
MQYTISYVKRPHNVHMVQQNEFSKHQYRLLVGKHLGKQRKIIKILKQYIEQPRIYSHREPSEDDAYILNTTTQLP